MGGGELVCVWTQRHRVRLTSQVYRFLGLSVGLIQAGQQPIGRLDPSDYPTGAHFFGWEPTYADPLHYDPSMRALCRQPPVLVHNNWLTGRANKLIRWRMHGLWFVDGGGREWRHQTEAPTALSSDLTAQPRPDGAAPNVELERLAVL